MWLLNIFSTATAMPYAACSCIAQPRPRIHRYSPSFTFGQWVYTIARNTHIDFERSRQESLSIDEKFTSPAASTPSPEESLISLQQRSQIENFIHSLPEQYRDLFKMRFLEDYSYDEILEKL